VGRTVAILAVGRLHLDRMVHLNNHFTQRQIDINQPNKVNKNNEKIRKKNEFHIRKERGEGQGFAIGSHKS
jgi:hypothetical protein